MSCNTPITVSVSTDSGTQTAVSDVPSTPTSLIDNEFLQEKYEDTQAKFEKACQQIVQLDKKIKDLEIQYMREMKYKKNTFRYNLRLRLSIVTGIKMMYTHYASIKAEELNSLHPQRYFLFDTESTIV